MNFILDPNYAAMPSQSCEVNGLSDAAIILCTRFLLLSASWHIRSDIY